MRAPNGHRGRPPTVRPVPLAAVLVGAMAAVAAGTWVTGCGGGSRPATEKARAPHRVEPARGEGSTTIATTTTTTSPGALPQTADLPSTDNPQFQAEMSALWNGIVSGASTPAMAAFFPEDAYVQVKAIGDPQADYQNRLVHDFALDIAAAHQLLGADPASAALVQVEVPAQYAHWVTPGVCENRVGYFEVANSRVVYRQNGVTRSFGIASLISWRGVWYVVHLGAVVRSADQGVVDDPETGPGTAAPSSTC